MSTMSSIDVVNAAADREFNACRDIRIEHAGTGQSGGQIGTAFRISVNPNVDTTTNLKFEIMTPYVGRTGGPSQSLNIRKNCFRVDWPTNSWAERDIISHSRFTVTLSPGVNDAVEGDCAALETSSPKDEFDLILGSNAGDYFAPYVKGCEDSYNVDMTNGLWTSQCKEIVETETGIKDTDGNEIGCANEDVIFIENHDCVVYEDGTISAPTMLDEDLIASSIPHDYTSAMMCFRVRDTECGVKVAERAFASIPSFVTTLSIEHNNITEIESFAFSGIPQDSSLTNL